MSQHVIKKKNNGLINVPEHAQGQPPPTTMSLLGAHEGIKTDSEKGQKTDSDISFKNSQINTQMGTSFRDIFQL